MQLAAPQAVELQVGEQVPDLQDLAAGRSQLQPAQGQLQVEGVEADLLEAGRHVQALGELLFGELQHQQRHADETQHGIQQGGEYQRGQAAAQSFGHGGSLR